MQKTNSCHFLPSVGHRKVIGSLPPLVEAGEGEKGECWNPSPFRAQQRGPQGSEGHLIPFVFT